MPWEAKLFSEAWVDGSTLHPGHPHGLGQKKPWQESQKPLRQLLSGAAAPGSGTQRRKMGWEMTPRFVRCETRKALLLCGNECQGANAY